MSFTIPSDSHSVGDTGHTTHHNNVADVLTGMIAGVHVNNTAYAGGADPTGAADSTAAFAAALAALPTVTIYATPPSGGSSATFHVGTIWLGAGTYKLGSSSDIGNLGPFVSVRGPGSQGCKLDYRGTGKCLSLRSTIRPTDDTFDDLMAFGSALSGFTIDGTNAGNGAVGLDYGDLEGGSLGPDLYITNYAGTGSGGFDCNNVVAWTENIYGRVIIRNCTNAVQFRVNGGDSSFSYNDLTFKVYASPNQNGIVLSGGAQYFNGRLVQRGNFALSSSAQSNAALTLTGNLSGIYSAVSYSRLDIQCETDETGANGPQTINFGSVASNGILNCTGIISFSGTWTPSNWTVTNSFAVGNFLFDGQVQGDSNLVGSGQAGKMILGSLIYGQSELFTDGGSPLGQGDFLGPTVLTQNITINLQRTIAAPQKKTFIITQASSGGPYTVAWPTSGSPTTSSPNIIWAAGVIPQMSTTPGATDVYFLESTDGATWYGRAFQASQVPDTEQFAALSSSYTLSNTTSAQKLLNVATNGALNVQASTSYFFEAEFDITGLSASTHQVEFGFGGTATFTSLKYLADSNTGAAGTLAAWQSVVVTSASATALMAAGTTTTFQARLKGILRVNAAGTVIPQVTQLTNAAAAVVGANSWFRVWPVGTGTATNTGNWS